MGGESDLLTAVPVTLQKEKPEGTRGSKGGKPVPTTRITSEEATLFAEEEAKRSISERGKTHE